VLLHVTGDQAHDDQNGEGDGILTVAILESAQNHFLSTYAKFYYCFKNAFLLLTLKKSKTCLANKDVNRLRFENANECILIPQVTFCLSIFLFLFRKTKNKNKNMLV